MADRRIWPMFEPGGTTEVFVEWPRPPESVVSHLDEAIDAYRGCDDYMEPGDVLVRDALITARNAIQTAIDLRDAERAAMDELTDDEADRLLAAVRDLDG